MSLASNDTDDTSMTIDMLASTIRSIDIAKQATTKLDDVIDIIEYLREQALTLHQENVDAADKLRAREVALTKREAELTIKQRACESLLATQPRKRRYFWR